MTRRTYSSVWSRFSYTTLRWHLESHIRLIEHTTSSGRYKMHSDDSSDIHPDL